MYFYELQVLYAVFLAFSIIRSTRTDTSSVSSEGMIGSDTCKIFCGGELLHYVQMARLFDDSKYFVDMKLKNPPSETENKFKDLLVKTKDSPSNSDLKKFVEENFVEPGSDLDSWTPEDWNPFPKFTFEVYDLELRNWIREVHRKWIFLGRKISSDVKENPDLYSQIYLPNPFVIPGGRFREMYYWDSYWIIEGLLLSEMSRTAKGMIENFIYLVNEYGYVPNGSRKYYLGRSQPPLLIAMVHLYWMHTRDNTFLKQVIGTLEKEYYFWLNNRSIDLSVDGATYKLFQYKVPTTSPRPESYFHDVTFAQSFKNGTERLRLFSELKSMGESGWDFSSRWFIADGEHTNNMTDSNILSIAPVCLNSLMGLNAKLMSDFYLFLGNEAKHREFKGYSQSSNSTMSRVFWSERDGVWLDYDLERGELIPGFYPSNLMPLWTETFGEERDRDFIVDQVIAYLKRNEVESYPGGIPASLLPSGQQWDMPNGWAPLQYFIVMGLHKAGKHNDRAKIMAHDLARDWILNVHQSYVNSTPHSLFEKYDVTKQGVSGGGGEYEVQEGFGWTNAVAMKFLNIYGHKIKTQDIFDPAPLVVGILLMLVSVISILSYMQRLRSCKRVMRRVEAC